MSNKIILSCVFAVLALLSLRLSHAGTASVQLADGTYSAWRRQDAQNITSPLVHRYIDPNKQIERKLQLWTDNLGNTEVTGNEFEGGQVFYRTFRLHPIDPESYFYNAYKAAGAKAWTLLKKPTPVRIVKTENPIPGLGSGYTVYIGDPDLPANPTEFWIRDDTERRQSNRRMPDCEQFKWEAESIPPSPRPVGKCELMCMYDICQQTGLTATPLFNQCGKCE